MPNILYTEILNLLEEAGHRWIISSKVINWCEENDIELEERCFIFVDGKQEFGLLFKNDADAVAFKLRWI